MIFTDFPKTNTYKMLNTHNRSDITSKSSSVQVTKIKLELSHKSKFSSSARSYIHIDT